MNNLGKLIWLDVETGGLTPEVPILEVGVLVTDYDLNPVDEGFSVTVHHTPEVLYGMDEWCVTQHTKSGLLQRSLESTLSLVEAEQQLLQYLQQHIGKAQSPMCGNSIHMDRMWMRHHMRELHDYFHFRNLDVSTLRIVSSMWNPALASGMNKMYRHTVMSDIAESIAELNYYRSNFLKV